MNLLCTCLLEEGTGNVRYPVFSSKSHNACAKHTHSTDQCTKYNLNDDSDYVPDKNKEEEQERSEEDLMVSNNTSNFIASFS